MSRGGGVAAWLVAAVALGYLGLMLASGAMPVQRQLVRTEAKGVLTVAPEQIRRVELSRAEERLDLRRTGETQWIRADGAAVGGDAGPRLSMAVQMMHRSGPVREIPDEELAGVDQAPFGLDPPRLVAALYDESGRRILTARFGGRNPEDFLQYMQVDGEPRVYLMSRFVGEEWSAALNAALSQ